MTKTERLPAVVIVAVALLSSTAALAGEAPWRDIPLDPAGEWRLDLSGEIRERYESVGNPDFGFIASYDDVLLHRLTLATRLRFQSALSIFMQIGNWEATKRQTGNPPTDRNNLDLAQAYVDLRLPSSADEISARVGRQEMSFGTSRLVSVRESPNVRRSFDGGRLTWKQNGYIASGFVVHPVEIHEGNLDDQSNTSELLGGIYLSSPEFSQASFDLYYLALERDDASFLETRAREERHTVGVRVFGRRSGWDWDWEAVGQFGTFGNDDIGAWTMATDTGYTFDSLSWKPRIGLKADIASGDSDANDGTLGTFNALYPKVPYFSEAGLVYPANIMDHQPNITLHPNDALEFAISWNVLWRHQTEDSFYQPPFVALGGTRGGGAYVGHQAQLSLQWTPSPEVEIKAWLVHFDVGETISRAGGENVNYGATSISYKF